MSIGRRYLPLGALVALLVMARVTHAGGLSPQGGTITSVTAGSCLLGGGSGGPISLSVNPSCLAGGTGDITDVLAGTGILVTSPTGPQPTVSVDTTYIQRRVTGVCLSTEKLLSINADGTANCAADADTTYTGTSPIVVTGTVLSHAASGVSAGSCTNCNLTIDTRGHVTAQANGSAGGGVTGSATVSYLPKMSTTTNIVASSVSDSGTLVTIAEPLNVTGDTSLGGNLALTTNGKQAYFPGTNQGSVFNSVAGASEDTTIGGGKTASVVNIGTANTGGVNIGSASNATAVGGTMNVVGALSEASNRVVSIASTGLSKTGATLTLAMTAQSCSAGSHISAATAVGVFTCTADAGDITGTLTSGKVPRATGTKTLADSSISDTGTAASTSGLLTVGTEVRTGAAGAASVYTVGSTLNYGYADATTATGHINYYSNAGGFGASRNLVIDDGQAAAVARFTGSGKTSEFFGAVTAYSSVAVTTGVSIGTTLGVTGATTLGTSTDTKGGLVDTSGGASCSGCTTLTSGRNFITVTATSTSFTVTFASAFGATPTCAVSTNGTVKGFSYTPGTGSIAVASATSGQNYDFVCGGH